MFFSPELEKLLVAPCVHGICRSFLTATSVRALILRPTIGILIRYKGVNKCLSMPLTFSLSTEKVWNLPPWWLWTWTGKVPVLALEQIPHPRSVSLPPLFGALQALISIYATKSSFFAIYWLLFVPLYSFHLQAPKDFIFAQLIYNVRYASQYPISDLLGDKASL